MSVEIPGINFIDYFSVEEIALIYIGINPFENGINIESLINSNQPAKLIRRGLLESIEENKFNDLKIRHVKDTPGSPAAALNFSESQLKSIIGNKNPLSEVLFSIKISKKELAKWFTNKNYTTPLFLEQHNSTIPSITLEQKSESNQERYLYCKIVVFLVNLLISFTDGGKYGDVNSPNLSQLRDSIFEYAVNNGLDEKAEGIPSADKKISSSFDSLIKTASEKSSKEMGTREASATKRLIAVLCKMAIEKRRANDKEKEYGDEESPNWEKIKAILIIGVGIAKFTEDESTSAIKIIQESLEFLVA